MNTDRKIEGNKNYRPCFEALSSVFSASLLVFYLSLSTSICVRQWFHLFFSVPFVPSWFKAFPVFNIY
jgi:hypothetical protein